MKKSGKHVDQNLKFSVNGGKKGVSKFANLKKIRERILRDFVDGVNFLLINFFFFRKIRVHAWSKMFVFSFKQFFLNN